MSKEEHFPIIRTIYLYIFALVGLIIVITGSIRALTMGLEVFVFSDSNKQEEINSLRPPVPYIDNVKGLENNKSLTEEERTSVKNWLTDYQNWKVKNDNFDYLSAQRQKESSSILASILVGLPLYLYHWSIIKKETKEKKLTENK